MRHGKLSNKDKIEAHDNLTRELSAYTRFAWHVVNGHAPDAVETVTEPDGGEHVFSLYGCTRMDGGILTYTFKHPINQHHHVDVHYFDAWCAIVDRTVRHGIGLGTETHIAKDRLRAVQRRMLDVRYGKEAEVCARCQGTSETCVCVGKGGSSGPFSHVEIP